MTPEQAADNVREIVQNLDVMRAHLSDEAEEIEQQWDALKRLDRKRADDASLLLYRLRPHLRDIMKFCDDCTVQIDMWKSDPFGRDTPNTPT